MREREGERERALLALTHRHRQDSSLCIGSEVSLRKPHPAWYTLVDGTHAPFPILILRRQPASSEQGPVCSA